MTTAPLISPTLGKQILQRKAGGFLCELDLTCLSHHEVT